MKKDDLIVSVDDRIVEPRVLGFDSAALRERIVRERRLRPEGNDQYIDVSTAPPYDLTKHLTDSDVARPPVVGDAEFAILGGGFGGLLAPARPKEAGIVVFEKGAE